MYQFLPSPDYVGKEENWVCVDGVFKEEDLHKIISIGESLDSKEGVLGADNRIDNVVRKCKTSWIPFNDESKFIYDTLSEVVVRVNASHFGFNLFGFTESFQYTTYTDDSDHYDWHMDKGTIKSSPRKLSAVLMLSDPDEFEGGVLELMTSVNVIKTEKKLGRIFIFPSWVLHRVTPVTKGTRKSLVSWVSGPKFV